MRMKVHGTWTLRTRARGSKDSEELPAESRRSRSPRGQTASDVRDELIDATRRKVRVEKRELQRTKAS